MNVTYESLAKLMADWPTLTVDGWQYRMRIAGDGFDLPRGLLLSREFREQVQVAVNYIKAHGIRLEQDSAQIKRAIENSAKLGQPVYVPEGALIAGALIVGFHPVRDEHSPHCTFKAPAKVAA